MNSSGGLARAASRSVFVTMVGQLARIVLQVGSVIVLARLLEPKDYGLVAMVLSVVGIGEILRDFGLSTASIQAKNLSYAERSNLFWINSGIGLVLALGLLATSPLVALVYKDERVIGLTMVLAFTFLFNGISTQLRADLNRDLRFGRIASADIIAQSGGLAVGVIMAVLGFGYWSLAGQQIATSGLSLVTVASFGRFRPQRYSRSVSIRRFVGFGLDVVGAQALGYASKNIDTLIIGTTLGATQLGFYNRAYQLLALPLSQINGPATRVALPVLSRLQDQAARFGSYLLAGQTAMLHVVLTIFSITSALAVPMIDVALGDKWASVAPLFQILAVAGVFQTAGYATYWVFLARGLTRSQLYWQLASRPVFIGIVIVGSFWGTMGVAIAYASSSCIMWALGLLWIRRATADLPIREMFFNVARATLGYGVAAVAAWAASLLVGDAASILRLLVGIAGWLVGWALVCLVWRPFRRDVSTVITMARLIRRQKSSGAPADPAAEGDASAVSASAGEAPREPAASVGP